ncbi:flavodoxin [Shewanella maritima]|uniref:flavodoxin n=1 Tax=Shewanella maritima TaxID=2520507 RepID=UPI003734FF3F
MEKVNIVFGTVYGGAQFTAETISDELVAKGYEVNLLQSAQLGEFTPAEDELLIMVCSTTGQGDLPDDIIPWFSRIQSSAPYLPHLRFAIIGLGDSSYPTFCGAAQKLEQLFSELGSKIVTPVLKIDACETMEPEQEATKWISVWHEAVQSLNAA